MPPSSDSLEPIFHPRSIALVGIIMSNPQHWTRTFFESLRKFDYDGRLYLVNPRGGEIDGHRVYPSLEDVPDRIDHVISTVPARAAPGLVQACAPKGVRTIHFCTSGFGETGEEEGIRLEAELLEMSRRTGIRLIGPNCMGLYCPESHLSFHPGFPTDSGPVAVISQSGGNASSTVLRSRMRGIRFSKVISYGNACDLNESDFLEYLTDDPKTEIIGLYVEGIRDGRRFRRALGKAARKKPVVLLKGGVTEGGTRAVAGHTGALAGSEATWSALCRQLGVIRASTLDEMVDVLVTFRFMPSPAGRRVAIISYGGGATVLLADQFEKGGLKIPPLPPELRQRIREYSPVAGNILGNPLDYSQELVEPANVLKTMRIIAEWDGIDFMVGYLNLSQAAPNIQEQMPEIVDVMYSGARAGSKQLAMILEPSVLPRETEEILLLVKKCAALKMPVYHSFTGAARAINLILSNNAGRAGKI